MPHVKESIHGSLQDVWGPGATQMFHYGTFKEYLIFNITNNIVILKYFKDGSFFCWQKISLFVVSLVTQWIARKKSPYKFDIWFTYLIDVRSHLKAYSISFITSLHINYIYSLTQWPDIEFVHEWRNFFFPPPEVSFKAFIYTHTNLGAQTLLTTKSDVIVRTFWVQWINPLQSIDMYKLRLKRPVMFQ